MPINIITPATRMRKASMGSPLSGTDGGAILTGSDDAFNLGDPGALGMHHSPDSASGDSLVVRFVAVMTIAVGCLLYAGVMTHAGFGSLLAIAGLSALVMFAESQPVRLNETTEFSVSFIPLVFAAVVFGPLAAMTVGAFGLLAEFRPPYMRWAAWTTTRVVVGGLAGFAGLLVHRIGTETFGWLLVCVAVVAVA